MTKARLKSLFELAQSHWIARFKTVKTTIVRILLTLMVLGPITAHAFVLTALDDGGLDSRLAIENTYKQHKQAMDLAAEDLMRIEAQIAQSKPEAFKQLFSQRITTSEHPFKQPVPSGYVLPIYSSRGASFGGECDDSNLTQSDSIPMGFYPIADFGSILIMPICGRVGASVIYLKTDDEFQALQSEHDYDKRMAWDLHKIAQIEQWLEQIPQSKNQPKNQP